MLVLYIANKNYSSWSLRAWLLMRELQIPFEERMRPFDDAPGTLPRDFSPTGKVPCLIDGDTAVWESLAIAEYLAERHPGVWPADPKARAFARCAAAEMHASFHALRNDCSMNCSLTIRLSAVSADLRGDLDRISSLWSEGLARFGGPFLAGESFTAVDAFFAPVAFRMMTYGLDVGEVAGAYAARLRALPSMREWYDDALLEPWREASHEADAFGAGTLLEDRRAAR